MAKEINPIFVLILIAVAVMLINNSQLFSIILQSPQVQYLNKPISAKFTTNLTNPTITALFNNQELSQIVNNETNQNIIYTQDIVNGTYVLTISNVTQIGIFKFIATEGNISEIQTIEVRRPFVDIKHDIISVIEKGLSDKISIKTYNPQGDLIEIDSLEVTVINPTNQHSQIVTQKINVNEYEFNFNYAEAGNYIFKIRGIKQGYDVREFTAITSVTKSAGIHPIIFVWSGAILLFLILLIIRAVKR